MECNLTIKCVGDCKPKDVIRLFERSFAKVTVYKETDPNGKHTGNQNEESQQPSPMNGC